MGSPTKTQVEGFLDKAAALIQLNLNGFAAELSGATVNPLWDLVDATGDPDVEAALMATALRVDRQSLPERYYAALPSIFGRPAPAEFLSALSALVTSADGGNHTNLRAYLSSISAKVHPLVGELIRAQNSGALTDSDGDITTCFAPNYVARSPDLVYVGADGSLASELTDAVDVGTADITLFGSDDHCLYIGSRYKFNRLAVALSTLASATITPTIQYWNGSAWTDVSGLSDLSVGFTKNSLISYTLPSDWVPCNKDGGGTGFADKTRLYYLRISRTANALVTPPVGSTIRIIPQPVLTGLTGSSHLGVDQPPLAVVVITAANTVFVFIPAGVDYARFAEPASGLIARAITPIAQDLTITFRYTDSAGSAAAQAQTSWTAPASLDTKALTLAGAAGVRTVLNTLSVVTTATEGVFVIEAPELRTPAL